jgi:DNA-binding MarR family transcriptional regulator
MPADAELSRAATDLRVVLGQLTRRLRSENARSISHLAVLSRLDRTGPQTTSGLAAAEHMRPQSMAEALVELQSDGLVDRTADPTDRRRILIELTAAGREFLALERRRREDWLSHAIADELTPKEQALLVDAVALLRRLAEL